MSQSTNANLVLFDWIQKLTGIQIYFKFVNENKVVDNNVNIVDKILTANKLVESYTISYIVMLTEKIGRISINDGMYE